MTTLIPGPPLHLVDDETVILRVRGHLEAFRLRIWRAQDEPSLVLVSQVPGYVSPCLATDRLANIIKSAWLAHAERGWFYFELDGQGLRAVTFEAFGHGDRARLYRPKYHDVPRNFLDEILGHAVEA